MVRRLRGRRIGVAKLGKAWEYNDRIAPEFHPGMRRLTPGEVGTEDMPTRHGDTAIAPGTGRLRPSIA